MLTILPGGVREALARGVRATVLRPVLSLQRGSVEREARFADPERLRAERDSLAALMVGQATLQSENRQLRELLGLAQRLPPSFVPAEVIRIPGRAVEGFFQLTSGSDRGIRRGAPVVASQGLVGRIEEVDENTSFGIDWMHPEFRAAAMSLDGSVYGLAEPRRGPGGEWMLALTGTPSHTELDEGALIVTSGLGGVFPRGVPIGTVQGLEEGGTSWQRTYLIRPLVTPAEMAHVLVLTGRQEDLEGADLAARWGIRPPPEPEPDTAAPGDLAGPGGAATGAGETDPSQRRPNLDPVGVQAPELDLPGVPVGAARDTTQEPR